MDAAQALACGLVNRVVAADVLAETTWELARRIEALPPLTVRMAKHVTHLSLSRSLDDARQAAGWGQVLTRTLSNEQLASSEQFLRKRPS
jgi:enoyl-CoA hydratase/carnithine racemase